MATNNYNAATAKWLEVIRTWPGLERAYGDLSYGYYLAGRYGECIDASAWCLERVTKANILGGCLFNAEMCHREIGHRREALEAFRRSLSLRENVIVRKALEELEQN